MKLFADFSRGNAMDMLGHKMAENKEAVHLIVLRLKHSCMPCCYGHHESAARLDSHLSIILLCTHRVKSSHALTHPERLGRKLALKRYCVKASTAGRREEEPSGSLGVRNGCIVRGEFFSDAQTRGVGIEKELAKPSQLVRSSSEKGMQNTAMQTTCLLFFSCIPFDINTAVVGCVEMVR